MNLVNGIGTLRNRLSDSHGRGGPLPVRPSPRHARHSDGWGLVIWLHLW